MKRVVLGVAVVLAAVLLCGCRNPAAQGFSNFVSEYRDQSKAGAAAKAEPSEIKTYTNGDFGEQIGFDVVAYPDRDGMRALYFFTADAWLGQIEYAADSANRLFVVRVARANVGRTLRGTYGSYGKSRTEGKVDDIDILTQTNDGGDTLVTWVKGDFQYSLHVSHRFDPPTPDEVAELVRGLDAQAREAAQ